MKLLSKYQNKIYLFFILVLAILLRLLFSNDPINGPDTANVLEVAHEIVDLGHFDPLEQRTHGNRYFNILFVSLAYSLVGTNKLGLISILMIPSILSIIVTYQFTIDLTSDEKLALIVSLIHATFPLDISLSGGGSLDMGFSFFIGLFFLFYHRSIDERWQDKKYLYAFASGLSAACLISIRVLGVMVYMAIAGYMLINKTEFMRTIKQNLISICGFLTIYSIEMLYLFITVGNPFYGVLRRLGFSAGGYPGLDSSQDRLNDPIYSVFIYPQEVFLPNLMSVIGVIIFTTLLYHVIIRDRKNITQIAIWAWIMFLVLEFFPLNLFHDPIGVIINNKPWFFEKQERFLTIFTAMGLALFAVILKKIKRPDYRKTIVIVIILSNLIMIFGFFQPMNNDYHKQRFRDVVDYLEDNNVDEIVIDRQLIGNYRAASEYKIDVIFVGDLGGPQCLSNTFYVVNSTAYQHSYIDLDQLNNWTVVKTFYSESTESIVKLDGFYYWSYTTVIFKIGSTNTVNCQGVN